MYYINYNNNGVELYDKRGVLISQDERDIGHQINKIRYIPKEKVIYVNTAIFQDKISMLVLCYQTVRQVYQLIQIYKRKNHLTVSENKAKLNQWEFSYTKRSLTPESDYVSPVEADMMAFATIMMQMYHRTNIVFKNNNFEGYDSLLNNMRKNI